jgi:hypothetical protein
MPNLSLNRTHCSVSSLRLKTSPNASPPQWVAYFQCFPHKTIPGIRSANTRGRPFGAGCVCPLEFPFKPRKISCDKTNQCLKETAMSNHVYKLMELTGSSPLGIDDAVSTAIAKAHETVRNIQWFTITETRGHVVDGKVAHWQVSLKIGFTLE